MKEDTNIAWIQKTIQEVQKKDFFSCLKSYSNSLLSPKSLQNIKDLLLVDNPLTLDQVNRYLKVKIEAAGVKSKPYQLVQDTKDKEKKMISFAKLILQESLISALQGCYEEQYFFTSHDTEFFQCLRQEVQRYYNHIQYFDLFHLLHEIRFKMSVQKLTQDIQKELQTQKDLQDKPIFSKIVIKQLEEVIEELNHKIQDKPITLQMKIFMQKLELVTLELNQSIQLTRYAWSILIQKIMADASLLDKILQLQVGKEEDILCWHFNNIEIKEATIILHELNMHLDQSIESVAEPKRYTSSNRSSYYSQNSDYAMQESCSNESVDSSDQASLGTLNQSIEDLPEIPEDGSSFETNFNGDQDQENDYDIQKSPDTGYEASIGF